MATGKSGKSGAARPGRGDSPINIGGGGGRGRKLTLSIVTDDWDVTNVGDQTVLSFKSPTKGAKKLILTSDEVDITVPLKGSINLEITVK